MDGIREKQGKAVPDVGFHVYNMYTKGLLRLVQTNNWASPWHWERGNSSGEGGEKEMNKPLIDILAEGHYAANLDAVPGESYDTEFESLVRRMLLHLGEDPGREGLERTPQRVAKAMDFLTSGYRMSVADIVKDPLFSEEGDDMVVVKDIEFYSLCEHHMLPFVGKAHVGYLPRGQVIGLSKIARIIDIFARRLQLQERLTHQVATALMEVLKAKGVGVVVEASHFCMIMRGVQKQNSLTVTSAMLGSFRADTRTRAEFLELIKRS